MHVELRGVVMVQDGVDVFQIDLAGVHIGFGNIRVRPMEMATTASSSCLK